MTYEIVKNRFISPDSGKVLQASDILSPISFVRIKADNDVNWNPQRGFLVTFDGQKAFIDDAYSGDNWIIARREKGLETNHSPTINVKINEYKRLKREPVNIHNHWFPRIGLFFTLSPKKQHEH